MSVQSGQSVTVLFTTRVFATGVGTNADSLPTGTLYVNGTSNAATVTVTNISTGLYKAAVTLPTLAIKDEVEILISATVSSVSDASVIWGDVKDVALDSSGDVTFNNTTIGTVTTLTNLPAITSGWLTATGIAASALNGKGDWNIGKTGYSLTVTPPTSAQIATSVWQDTTAGDFTVASSIGKSLYTSGNAPGASSGIALVGSNMGTATSVTGAVASVTGNVGGSVASVTGAVGSVTGNVTGSVGSLATQAKTDVENATWNATLSSHLTSGSTGAALNAAGSAGDPWTTALPGSYTSGQAGYIIGHNIDATISSRSTLTQTQVTGGAYTVQSASCVLGDARVAHLDADVSSRLAPAGTLAAVTNLTNAPTAGDFTATMKTSLGTAVAASAVASVTGSVGGVTAPVTLTSAYDAAKTASQFDSATDEVLANVTKLNSDTQAATNLGRSAAAICTGTVGAGSTTTSIVTSALNPAAAATGQFIGRIVIFSETTTTANLRGQATNITASTSGGVLTCVALTDAPVSGDTFTIS